MTGDLEKAISSHVAGLLLRYFRPATNAATSDAAVDRKRDLDLLRVQWSLSNEVAALCGHILLHRHETQSFLSTVAGVASGTVQGRIDAHATVMHRLLTGDTSVTAFHRPVRSYNSGPNQVTAWVLQQAWLLAKRFTSSLPSDATYRYHAEAQSRELGRVRKIEAIQSAMLEVDLIRRPSASALRSAAQSRRRTYRLAYEAYRLLARIEAGEKEAIKLLLEQTLLGPLKTWQRFELSTGLAVADALGRTIAEKPSLGLLQGDNRQAIIQVGRFEIYWQSTTPWYAAPTPEPSETITQKVISALGLRADSDRPDLIVVDREKNAVVAVVEVKFFLSDAEDARDRLRGAAHQIVRYARGYRDLQTIEELISNSVVMLARRTDVPQNDITPYVFDFEDIISETKIDAWASNLTQH